jgi:hypothetical protein
LGANLGKQKKVSKAQILAKIQELDLLADASGLDDESWAYRYHFEEELIHLLREEEEYWRQRGRLNWVLQGNANTAHFHAVANGRRCKCAITYLSSDEGEISNPQDYEFYIGLMGTEDPKFLGLRQDC